MVSKKGFTLQEVLITLFILGVIAAILFPILNKATPDTDKIKLRKAYDIVEKTVNYLINDDTNYPADVISSGIPLGFSYTDTDPNIPANTDKFCYLFTQELNTTGDVSCAVGTGTFRTADGMVWDYTSATNNTTLDNWIFTFYIDVNGDKGPNCRQAGYATCAATYPNPDTYKLEILYNGKVNIDAAGQAILATPTKNIR